MKIKKIILYFCIFINIVFAKNEFINNFATEYSIASLETLFNSIHERILYFENYKYGAKLGKYNLKTTSIDDADTYNEIYEGIVFSQNYFWYNLHFNSLKQGKTANFMPWTTDYYGISLGYDVKTAYNTIVGFSFLYNNADTNLTKIVNEQTDNEKKSTTTYLGSMYINFHNEYVYLLLDGFWGENKSTLKIRESPYVTKYYGGKANLGFNIMLYHELDEKNKYNKKYDVKYIEVYGINEKNKISRLELLNKEEINKYTRKEVGVVSHFVSLVPNATVQYIDFDIEDNIKRGLLDDNGDPIYLQKDTFYKRAVISYKFGADLIFNKEVKEESAFQIIFGAYWKQQSTQYPNLYKEYNDNQTNGYNNNTDDMLIIKQISEEKTQEWTTFKIGANYNVYEKYYLNFNVQYSTNLTEQTSTEINLTGGYAF
ncbi:MAG: hypothetical protein Ta2D_03770 [Rickettsiales bacterium]|nr:MAG: hypothetical protein Ta2D_03770 [Rickettsiales bacterium]